MGNLPGGRSSAVALVTTRRSLASPAVLPRLVSAVLGVADRIPLVVRPFDSP